MQQELPQKFQNSSEQAHGLPQQQKSGSSEFPSGQPPFKRGIGKRMIFGLVVVVLLVAVIFFGVKYFSDRFGDTTVIEEIFESIPDPFPHDKDRDGISDVEEERLGTSDLEFDTDGDGLTDKEEIERWKTDPLNPDTDDDGFFDGFEVYKGYNPNGEGEL